MPSPFEAAEEYHRLYVEDGRAGRAIGHAASYARTYEETASSADFEAFLRYCDCFLGINPNDTGDPE